MDVQIDSEISTKVLQSYKKHTSGVSALLHVGKPFDYVITVSWDSSIKVWDIKTCRDIATITEDKISAWSNHIIQWDENTVLVAKWEKAIRSYRLLQNHPYLKFIKEFNYSVKEPKVPRGYTIVKVTEDIFVTTSSQHMHVVSYKHGDIIRKIELKSGYYAVPIKSRVFEDCFYAYSKGSAFLFNINEDSARNEFSKHGNSLLSICSFKMKHIEVLVCGFKGNIAFYNTSLTPKDEKQLMKIMKYGGANIWCVRTIETTIPQYILAGDVESGFHIIFLKNMNYEEFNFDPVTVYKKKVFGGRYVRDIATILPPHQGYITDDSDEQRSYQHGSVIQKLDVACGSGGGEVVFFRVNGIKIKVEDEQGLKDLIERSEFLMFEHEGIQDDREEDSMLMVRVRLYDGSIIQFWKTFFS